jgi:hypothetical protein
MLKKYNFAHFKRSSLTININKFDGTPKERELTAQAMNAGRWQSVY